MRERRHELRKEQRWQRGDTENWPGQSRQHTYAWMLNQSQKRYQEEEKKSSRPLEQDQTSALEKQVSQSPTSESGIGMRSNRPPFRCVAPH